MSLPLFEDLLDKVENEINIDDLSNDDKSILLDNIHQMDTEGHELIYVIVKLYETNYGEGVGANIIPYNGRSQKAGIKFDINKFPIKFSSMSNIKGLRGLFFAVSTTVA